MEEKDIRNAVLGLLAAQGTKYVPVGVSARHVHLSQADLDRLFGPGRPLTPCKPLSQPGQFAAQERVTVAGPKGELANVRVLGPVRKQTQVEVTFSDLMRLGLKGMVRMSGDVDGTPGCTLKGPAGEVQIPCGVIVAARHLHLSGPQAALYGVKDGDAVKLRMDGPRPGVLEQVVCRVGEGHDLEVHLDTDEANALGISTGTLLEVLSGCSCGGDCHRHNAPPSAETASPVLPPPRTPMPPEPSGEIMSLVTERDIEDAWRRGEKVIFCRPRCIITDAARERAASLEITFQISKGQV